MEPAPILTPTHPPHPEYFTPPPYIRQAERRNAYIDKEQISLRIAESNPARLLQFFEKLTDDSSKALEVKINTYLMKEAQSDTSFLIHLLPKSEEAMIQVMGLEELEKSLYFSVSEETMKDLVRYTCHEMLKCDISLNPQIEIILNELFKDQCHQFILVPILSKKLKIFPCNTRKLKPVLLVCFVNSTKSEEFVIKASQELFRFCQTVLLNTLAKEDETRRNRKYETVLRAVRNLLPRLEEVNDLFTNIAFEARKLTNARRSSLFLLDAEKVTFCKTFFNNSGEDKFRTCLRMVGDEKLAKRVVKSGKILNIKNAQEHPLFDKGIDEINGTKTRNILCFPIRDEDSIIGVVELCNKKGGDFTYLDEEAGKIFGVYCGLAIVHGTKYKQKKETQERANITNDIILQHKKVNDDDVKIKVTCGFMHVHPQLDQFNFPPRAVMPREMICFIVKMFEDLGFIKAFSINTKHLTKFLMLAEKCHKDVPYHNWTHSFSTAHSAYLFLKKFQIVEKLYISNLEAMAFFMACLCRNLDHRGVNNPFLLKPNNTLSTIYASQGSVMERHHFAQALTILNSEGCNFLEGLDIDDYSLCLNLFRDLILAGDLACHFKLYNSQFLMTQAGYDNTNPQHRYIFTSLLVTCAGFADQVKDWTDIQQSMTETIEEFITLGSIRDENGIQPIVLPIQNVKLIPDLQIDFLRTVCLPAFKLLALLFPSGKELVFKIKENILCWEAAKPLFIEALLSDKSYLEVLKSEELCKRVEKAITALLKK